MAAKRKPYQTYPEAFKLEALRLLEESDRPVSEVARQLGTPDFVDTPIRG